MERVQAYFQIIHVMVTRAKILSCLLLAGWVLYPVALQTVLHPSDALGFLAWMQHEPIPNYYSEDALRAGFKLAIVALAMLSLLLLVLTTLLYRQAMIAVPLWPMAVLTIGGLDNAIWWISTGRFDPVGALVGGIGPAVSAIICLAVCEKLGRKFMFGSD